MEKFNVETVMEQIREEIRQTGPQQDDFWWMTPTLYFARQIEWMSRQKQLVIFGAGNNGKLLYKELVKQGIRTVCCFCDNSVNMAGSELLGLEVLPPETAFTRYPEASFAISVFEYENEIMYQLADMGVPIKHIRIINIKATGLEL